jgi:hypothetical protein
LTDDPLCREAIRIYRRYQTEVVEALTLCPWAERARLDRRVHERVLTADVPDVAASLTAIAELDRQPEVEVGLLIYPRLALTRATFERFVADLVQADAQLHKARRAPFAMAAFHPDAEADMTDPERLVPFVRRTPDPTVQLIRLASLEGVREGFFEGTQFIDVRQLVAGLTAAETRPLRERIARANHRTVERLGVEELERRFAAIRADRDAAYAALARATDPRCPSS